jgi:hypothetical protein
LFPLGCPAVGDRSGLDPWDDWSRVADVPARLPILRSARLPIDPDEPPKLPLLQLLIGAILVWLGLLTLVAAYLFW